MANTTTTTTQEGPLGPHTTTATAPAAPVPDTTQQPHVVTLSSFPSDVLLAQFAAASLTGFRASALNSNLNSDTAALVAVRDAHALLAEFQKLVPQS